MFQSKLYEKAPYKLQNVLISTRAYARKLLREGKEFEKYCLEIKQTEKMNSEQLRDYQYKKLKQLLNRAVSQTDYYSKLFKDNGIIVSDIRKLEDIATIPFLSKGDVLNKENQFLSVPYKRRLVKGSTSGTTGTPVSIYQNLSAINRENAFLWRQLAWAGYKRRQRRAWIRGDMIVPFEQKEGPYWRYNSTDNMLMMSSYHLSEKTIKQYLDALLKFDPVLIQAYPSSIGFIAAYLKSHNECYEGKSLISIVTSSELVADQQRQQIEQCFGVPVYDWYGSFERVSAIGTCEYHSYHVMDDYSYTELLSVDDGTVEIVGTGFSNSVMPLLRYRTGDSVVLDDSSDICPCGRSFRLVKKVLGRMDDYVVTSDGRRIGRLDHVFKGLTSILEAQIVQEKIDEVQVLVVPMRTFKSKEAAELVSNMKKRIGENVIVKVDLVTSIPRSSNGKFRAVISKVKG